MVKLILEKANRKSIIYQDREVRWVKFLSQERIVLVQRETSATRKGCEAGPERGGCQSPRGSQ